MNSKTVVATLMAMSLLTGGPAFAEMDGAANELPNPHAYRYDDERQFDRRGLPDRGFQDRRFDDRRDRGFRDRGFQGRNNDDYADRDHRWQERGAGLHHQFRRGDWLAPQYRHRNYVVQDWRGHRLSAPARGYQWIQSGNDYLLVEIATGVVVQVLLNN